MRAVTVVAGVLAASYAVLRFVPEPAPSNGGPFGGPEPLVLAHRGGMGQWPEHTLYAFRAALAAGTDVLELDVRRSADRELVVFHDAELDRTTEGRGALAAASRAELGRLDAGYRFSTDGGRTFPYRGRGLQIPSLGDVFDALPGVPASIELKEDDGAAADALCAVLEQHGAGERVLVASFHQAPIDALRAACPSVATAATPGETLRFRLASAVGLPNLAVPQGVALHLFERLGPIPIVTPGFVSDARAQNLPVYVWGTEGAEGTRRLLAAGVAGITTDRPDDVLEVLGRAPVHRPRPDREEP